MALPDSEKTRALLGVSALLASSASNAKCNYSAWSMNDGFQRVDTGVSSPSEWHGIEFSHSTDPLTAYSAMPPLLKRNGLRVLISDLLWDTDPSKIISTLSEGAAVFVIIQLLSKFDVDPVLRGNYMLSDMETDDVLEAYIDDSIYQRYKTALETHQQAWKRASLFYGAKWVSVTAGNVVKDWRLEVLESTEVLTAV